LKKRTKKLLSISGGTALTDLDTVQRATDKSFLVLFFKKEHSSFLCLLLAPALAAAAPAPLAPFAFLVGDWQCDARVKSEAGGWQKFRALWQGRFILDGHAIEDEYRMTDPAGKLIVLGMNFRTYDAARHGWIIKWLNALTGTWSDLAPSELGGVATDGTSMSYAFREPSAANTYSRVTYTNDSRTHFTWRGEQSQDGARWREFMVIACDRRAG
jgi:hypothetical protein